MKDLKLKNTSKVPKLRFGEFEGEWEEKRLGEIAKFSKWKWIPKNSIVDDWVVKCIRYWELYTYYWETIKNIKSKTNLDKDDLVLSEYNDIIIPASWETQIDIATASCVLEDDVALWWDLNIIKTKNDGVFLSYYLNSNKKFDIARLSQWISVVHLYSSQLQTLKINIPSLPEQKKIASFLSSVDEKIEIIREKKKSLEEYKKGVMQKIFKQEIRFKDENWEEFREWEEKRLGEIIKNYRLWWNYKNSERKTENVLIKMWNLWRWKISLDKIQYINKEEEVFEQDKIKYWDLFFNTRNTLELVWKVSIWRNELEKAYYNSNLIVNEFW